MAREIMTKLKNCKTFFLSGGNTVNLIARYNSSYGFTIQKLNLKNPEKARGNYSCPAGVTLGTTSQTQPANTGYLNLLRLLIYKDFYAPPHLHKNLCRLKDAIDLNSPTYLTA
jgi:hypothetical protein